MPSKNENGPDCFNCKWRGTVPGSCHLSCKAPESTVQHMHQDPFVALMGMLSKRTSAPTNVQFAVACETLTGLRVNPHGVEQGWAAWPINFDPVWFTGECKLFEENK